ncbi:MAG: hypothetical protein IT326_05095 [Anaerolineae bacterium]|nr:hypothetical protein [Anaerolineae bacterium]
MQEGAHPNRPIPSERFQRVLAFASDEASGLGHGYINCQHLLYALACEGKGLAGAVLFSLGITAEKLHVLLADSGAGHDRIPENYAFVDFSQEARMAVECAAETAATWGHRSLDTEHLLYGIISKASSADEMLSSLSVHHADVLQQLEEMQRIAPVAAVRDEATHAYRFTLDSAWVLSLAAESAREAGQPGITSLHLLLALLRFDGPARQALKSTAQLTEDDVRLRIGSGSGRPEPRPERRLPLARDTQMILGFAIGEAWNRGHQAVTPLHLAMGMARCERHAALDYMAEHGVDQARLIDLLEGVIPPAVR